MSEIQVWDGWLEDDSRAPHEAISAAILGAEQVLEALHKLRPDSLRNVYEEINKQVADGLRDYLENAELFDGRPGMINLNLHDELVKQLDIMEVATEIATWRNEPGYDQDAVKEAWALKFEAAAALLRGSKENP